MNNNRKTITQCDKVYLRKSSGYDLYKWCPSINNLDKSRGTGNNRPYYCTATPNSQGYDFITTYCYNIIVIDYTPQRSAYVVCDYVE
jgi:hypothetical protein